MTAPAAWASAWRRWASRGPNIVWWPARPLVRLTSLTPWPRAHHFAAVPPALMSESSGWAPMTRIRSRSSVTEPSALADVRVAQARLCSRDGAPPRGEIFLYTAAGPATTPPTANRADKPDFVRTAVRHRGRTAVKVLCG